MGIRHGILKEITHREWEPQQGILDAGLSIDTTKVKKIIHYLKFTFIEFKIGKAKKKYNNSIDGFCYFYEYPQLRNKWKKEIGLKDDQDLIIDPNAGQTVQLGKKFDNKTVIEIYSKRKSNSLKQIQIGDDKGTHIINRGEEDLDHFIFVRFSDHSIIKIKRERIASLKKINN